jgi:hypothetical protein
MMIRPMLAVGMQTICQLILTIEAQGSEHFVNLNCFLSEVPLIIYRGYR